MKPTVISQEYLALQTEISNKQVEWAKQLDAASIVEKQNLSHKQIPVIAQVKLNVDVEKYQQWINELADLLAEKNTQLADDITKLKELLNEKTVLQWADEVLAFNQLYFQSFSEENHVAEWLPYFLAEHSLRPYLQVVAEVYKEELPKLETKGSCSCCGEPLRIAVLEGKGTKHLVCPRCEAKWQQKRLKCTHCGNEDHTKLSYYNVEKDPSAKIEVCTCCNSYTKVIDTRKLFKKQTAFLMDISTIHLDIIAQEKGFGVTEGEEVKS